MRKANAIAVAFAAILGATPAVAGQGDQIDQLFAAADGNYAEKGYHPSGWSQRGAAGQGAEVRFTVPLEGDKDHSLVGVCDTDCSNIDMQLLDGSGTEVARDVEADDVPIVGTHAATPQNYTLVVQMVSCSADSCAFGIKGYVKD